MKRMTRALILVLVLAMVVSAFALVGAFAAEETYGTTLVDMDSKTSLGKDLSAAYDAGYKDVNGQRIWTFSYDKAKHTKYDEFWALGGTGKSNLTVRDIAATSSAAAVTKNTDYWVVDFDIATDSELFDEISFNCYLYSSAGKRVGSGQNGKTYPAFFRDADGRICVGNGNGSNKVYNTNPVINEWTNVTLIYDFHVKDDGSIANDAYVYYDGVYAGKITSFVSTTAHIDSIRVESVRSTFPNQSVKFANFTTTKFGTTETRYNGPMSEAGALGNPDVKLSDLKDLKYTQEDCPGNSAGYDARPVIATVVSTVDGVEQERKIRDAADFGKLNSGDVVTVRRSFAVSENEIEFDSSVIWQDYNGVSIFAPQEGETPAVSIDRGIATITKTDGDSTTYVFVGSLSGLKHLEEGMAVTVHKSFTSDAPGNALVTRGNVTWLDANGVNIITPAEGETPAVTIPSIFAAKADSDWVVMIKRATENIPLRINGEGKAEDIYVSGKTVSDPLFDAFHASAEINYVVLFDDVTIHGRGTHKSVRYGGLKFDLNGHTLTIAITGGRTYIKPQTGATSYNTENYFKNGTLNFGRLDDPTTPDVNEAIACNGTLMLTESKAGGANDHELLFENLTVNFLNVSNTSALIDQRAGHVVYRNCTVNSNYSLTSLKAENGVPATLTIENSEVNLTGAYLTQVKNVSDAYGSFDTAITITNSHIKTASNLVNVLVYANNLGTSANHLLNNNVFTFNITDSTIEAQDGKIVDLLHANIQTYDESGVAENKLKLTVNLNINGSDIKLNNLFNTLTVIDAANGKDADVNVGVNIGAGTKLMLTKENGAPAYLYVGSATNAGANVALHLADGVKLNAALLFDPAGAPIDTVTYDSEASKLAYTTLDADYMILVTPDNVAYSYKLGERDAVPFFWVADDVANVNIAMVVTLDAGIPGIYHYEWNKPVDNAYTTKLVKDYKLGAKSNLTLTENLYFNLFVNAEQYDLVKNYVTVTDKDGAKLVPDAETVKIGETDYYKFQVKGIYPKNAGDNAINVAINVTGAYGDALPTAGGSFTVLGYAENILNQEKTDDKSVALIKALLNYVKVDAEQATDGDYTETVTKATALIGGTTFGEVEADEVDGKLTDANVAVAYGDKLYWYVKTDANATVYLEYVSNGTKMGYSIKADEEGIVKVYLKAADFANGITVTKDGETATVTLAAYYAGVTGDAKDMVAAIYHYTKAAAAYKATYPENN